MWLLMANVTMRKRTIVDELLEEVGDSSHIERVAAIFDGETKNVLPTARVAFLECKISIGALSYCNVYTKLQERWRKTVSQG